MALDRAIGEWCRAAAPLWPSQMMRVFSIILFVFLTAGQLRTGDADIATYSRYQIGDPVILNLVYKGGIAEWDGGASIEAGKLMLANAMFIAITDSKNESVKPKSGKVINIWADTYFRNPFSLVVDITEFYDLSRPGIYILRWGSKGVEHDVVHVEIVEN